MKRNKTNNPLWNKIRSMGFDEYLVWYDKQNATTKHKAQNLLYEKHPTVFVESNIETLEQRLKIEEEKENYGYCSEIRDCIKIIKNK